MDEQEVLTIIVDELMDQLAHELRDWDKRFSGLHSQNTLLTPRFIGSLQYFVQETMYDLWYVVNK